MDMTPCAAVVDIIEALRNSIPKEVEIFAEFFSAGLVCFFVFVFHFIHYSHETCEECA